MTLVKALTHAAEGVMKYGGRAVEKAGTSAARKASGSVFMEVARSFIKKSNPAEMQLGKPAEELFLKRFLSLKNIKIDKQTVARLEKLEGMEFFETCKEVLCKKMGIPALLAPKITVVSQLPGTNLGIYKNMCNEIAILDSWFSAPKGYIFGGIAHELQHAKQNLILCRDSSSVKRMIKSIREEATRNIKKSDLPKLGKEEMKSAINLVKETDEKKLVEMMSETMPREIALQKAKRYKMATTKELKKLIQADFEEEVLSEGVNEGLKDFYNYQKQCTSIMGDLTPEEKVLAQAFRDRYCAISSDEGLAYWHSLEEQEAYRFGTAAKRAYTRALYGRE